MTGPSTCESRSRQARRPADFPGRLKGLAPPRGPLGRNFRSFIGLLVSWVPEYGNLGVQEGDFSCSPWLTLPHRFPHKRARPPPLHPGCRGFHVSMAVFGPPARSGPIVLPSSGGVSRVAKGADCKSAALWLRRFESCLPHQPSLASRASARQASTSGCGAKLAKAVAPKPEGRRRTVELARTPLSS